MISRVFLHKGVQSTSKVCQDGHNVSIKKVQRVALATFESKTVEVFQIQKGRQPNSPIT